MTLDESFLELARVIPGGFAGVYYGDDGKLRERIKDLERSAQAKNAVLTSLPLPAGTPNLRREDIVIIPADYSFDQLHGWYQVLLARIFGESACYVC